MKTKLLRKLRKLAKESITIDCKITRNDIKYTVREDSWSYREFNSKGEAIDYLNKIRREYILQQLDNIREDMLNKELSKI